MGYAWLTIGKTVLVASPRRVVLRRQVGWFRRTRELDSRCVSRLRLVIPGRSTLISDAAVRLGFAGPTIVLDCGGETISIGPFSLEVDAQRAAGAVAGHLETTVSASEIRNWHPKWIVPLSIASTVLGGLIAWWMGTNYGEQVAARCAVCGPGNLPLECTFATLMTATGTAMVIGGIASALGWAAWRRLRRGSAPPA